HRDDRDAQGRRSAGGNETPHGGIQARSLMTLPRSLALIILRNIHSRQDRLVIDLHLVHLLRMRAQQPAQSRAIKLFLHLIAEFAREEDRMPALAAMGWDDDGCVAGLENAD